MAHHLKEKKKGKNLQEEKDNKRLQESYCENQNIYMQLGHYAYSKGLKF